MRITALIALALVHCALTTPTASAAGAQKKVLVELREQGGFAGIDNHVIVYASGCARLRHRTDRAVAMCLTNGEMRGLRGDLKRLRLGRSEAEPPGADFIKYTLAYRGHRIARYSLPSTWRPVVRRLEKILQKHGVTA
ncbi:hypothetical protein Aple_033170 [Acrocarpospora pleiomorpha]|uniref:Uncharacterized protein n=1 Tax=Acrocarpospora pleiomorpha TaxID=90975 RepID=A0A5M3XL92_9ACTN|nr:hypothetical protein Aple_033170 [Acrocarpospora pleiomorpha]